VYRVRNYFFLYFINIHCIKIIFKIHFADFNEIYILCLVPIFI
jgi:hypothetical protein